MGVRIKIVRDVVLGISSTLDFALIHNDCDNFSLNNLGSYLLFFEFLSGLVIGHIELKTQSLIEKGESIGMLDGVGFCFILIYILKIYYVASKQSWFRNLCSCLFSVCAPRGELCIWYLCYLTFLNILFLFLLYDRLPITLIKRFEFITYILLQNHTRLVRHHFQNFIIRINKLTDTWNTCYHWRTLKSTIYRFLIFHKHQGPRQSRNLGLSRKMKGLESLFMKTGLRTGQESPKTSQIVWGNSAGNAGTTISIQTSEKTDGLKMRNGFCTFSTDERATNGPNCPNIFLGEQTTALKTIGTP